MFQDKHQSQKHERTKQENLKILTSLICSVSNWNCKKLLNSHCIIPCVLTKAVYFKMTFPRNLNFTLIPLRTSLTKIRLQQLIHQFLCLTIVIPLKYVKPFTLPKFSPKRILTRNKEGMNSSLWFCPVPNSQ